MKQKAKRILAALLTCIMAFAGAATTVFASDYHIQITQAEGGKIYPTALQISENSNHTLYIDADAGYYILDVLVDGKSVGAVESYTFKNIMENHDITAVFWKQGVPVPDAAAGPAPNQAYYVDETGKEIPIGYAMEGKYGWVYKLPAAAKTVLYRNVDIDYADVPEDHPQREAIAFAGARELFPASAENQFGPEKVVTRQLMAYTLAKLLNADLTPYSQGYVEDPYTDVSVQNFAGPAIAWCKETGLMKGVTADQFNPEGVLDRESLSCILDRVAEWTGYYRSGYYRIRPSMYLGEFSDVSKVSGWAMASMSYCFAMEFLTPVAPFNTLEPQAEVTRGDLAAVLQTFVAKAFSQV